MRIALKVLKWAGIVLGGLIALIIITVVVVYFVVGGRLNKAYDIQPATVAIPADAPSEASGWPLFLMEVACQECHGENLGGDVMEDDPAEDRVVARNLTSGKGGIGGSYTDTDWVCSIRHGVDPDGKPLVLMPSHEFNKLGDADLGLIIAYVKNLPPMDNELPSTTLGPLGRIIILVESEFLPATVIDHDAPRPAEPVPGVTVEYGEYMAFVCTICHGESFSGDTVPGEEDPDAPKAANLTPGGGLARWPEADFINTLRTGTTPGGRQMDNEFMPWEGIGSMTDGELKATWMYL